MNDRIKYVEKLSSNVPQVRNISENPVSILETVQIPSWK